MKLAIKAIIAIAAVGFFMASAARADGVRIRGLFDTAVVSDSSSDQVKIDLDEEKKEPAKEPPRKREWGGFGGPMIQYLVLDLSPLDPMTDDRGMDNFNEQMLLVGGVGGLIHKQFRFGGFGFGNSQDTADRVSGLRRSADMSIGGGGLLFEYNNALNPKAGLAAGAMLGAGGIQLKASGADLGPEKEWDGDGEFFMAYPYLGFWVAPVSWLWVQLDAGYLYFNMDTSTSEFDNYWDQEMVDGDINGGFQAGLKVLFGSDPALR